TEQNPLHQYDSAGVYKVCLTVSNQYGSDTYCRTVYMGVSSTDSPEIKSEIMVSPNPFSQRLAVSMSANMRRSPVFLLYDALGQLVHKAQIAPNGEITPGHLPSGVYFWQIWEKGGQLDTGKLIKN
ncbi:MAG: T9SS type A sorting domain-containing protein, partial [Saprospiraceae bacterium]|nr:T9SS type A sorting domain-containing protein [Saprospiraceae bacterium]